jgi:hypothetical protein
MEGVRQERLVADWRLKNWLGKKHGAYSDEVGRAFRWMSATSFRLKPAIDSD